MAGSAVIFASAHHTALLNARHLKEMHPLNNRGQCRPNVNADVAPARPLADQWAVWQRLRHPPGVCHGTAHTAAPHGSP